jgi:nitrogen fixation NifU-like protein
VSDLSDLYQEVILDHYRRPRNSRVLEDADRSAEGYNPLCGDRLTVYLKLRDNRVEDVTFQGSGCAISQASASVMTETLKGKSRDEIRDLFQRFQDLVTGVGEPDLEALGEMAAMSGVQEFPARVKCATLSWHAMKAALEAEPKVDEPVVSTEEPGDRTVG